ncbi:hypothetical protein BaRGS_00039661 [Batillaria attramentaria]|uniref:Uncharacterized protein n=1 Tax=Batillaria attramentaria TaxID=370345 RepID=A0ABD0J360_9CAEN
MGSPNSNPSRELLAASASAKTRPWPWLGPKAKRADDWFPQAPPLFSRTRELRRSVDCRENRHSRRLVLVANNHTRKILQKEVFGE